MLVLGPLPAISYALASAPCWSSQPGPGELKGVWERETVSCRHARSTCWWACARAAGCCSSTGVAFRSAFWACWPTGGVRWCGRGRTGWTKHCCQATQKMESCRTEGGLESPPGNAGRLGPASTRTAGVGWTHALTLAAVEDGTGSECTCTHQRKVTACQRATAKSWPRWPSPGIWPWLLHAIVLYFYFSCIQPRSWSKNDLPCIFQCFQCFSASPSWVYWFIKCWVYHK